MASRPLTPEQRHQHAAFLKQLARTGNARQAAIAIGVRDSTLINRRKRHPAFALQWDATLAAVHARLHDAGGARPAKGDGKAGRALPGETTIVIRKNGRLQMCRARSDAVTRAAEQRFLLALSATANISLAAAAAGASPAAFRKRKNANPAFAREMQTALAQGYERLEGALLESWLPVSGDNTAWRGNDPPALPPMTPAQALQLLAMHRKQVRWREVEQSGRLYPGETSDVRSARMARLYRAKIAADAEAALDRELARALDRVERRATPVVLPDLEQVTGWSKADPAAGSAGERGLSGGGTFGRPTPAQRERGLQAARAARCERTGTGNGRDR